MSIHHLFSFLRIRSGLAWGSKGHPWGMETKGPQHSLPLFTAWHENCSTVMCGGYYTSLTVPSLAKYLRKSPKQFVLPVRSNYPGVGHSVQCNKVIVANRCRHRVWNLIRCTIRLNLPSSTQLKPVRSLSCWIV